jgi:hypothetical protein
MLQDSNPYRSPAETDPPRSGRSWLLPILVSIVGVVGALFLGLQLAGVLVFLVSLLWLHLRGAEDAAFPDPILFITGVSLLAYIVGRWDRAKVPFLFCVGSFVAMYLGGFIAQP